MSNPEPLATELREAEKALKTTLEQACATNVSRADTGELIRVEEMLAIASEAAKKAISIRRRQRQDRPTGYADERPRKGELERAAATDAAGSGTSQSGEHREFEDDDGVTWQVWAVHPTRSVDKDARLLGEFRNGWLAFESDSAKRRLNPIPVNWEHLDRTGLCGLLAQARDVPLRRADERQA